MGGVSHANTTHLLLPQRCCTCAVKCATLESFANNVNSITVSSRDGLRFSFYYTLFFLLVKCNTPDAGTFESLVAVSR